MAQAWHKKSLRNPAVRGKYIENRTLEAVMFYRDHHPPWLLGVEKAPDYLDRGHVDLVVRVEGGVTFYLQIKSSEKYKQLFESVYPDIPVILVKESDPRRNVFDQFLEVVSHQYNRLIAARGNQPLQAMSGVK